MRQTYRSGELEISDLKAQPIEQFKIWFENAIEQNVPEPNAFVLSTVNAEGQPNARVVLIKEIREDGIVFYTNYNSVKGSEIEENKQVSALFFYQPLFQQIRFKGVCEKISAEDSDHYFNQRPLDSRIGAMVSPQSKAIESRDWLMNQWEAKQNEVGIEPKRPQHWGGYIIKITEAEFWQGQPSRLHDRFRYSQANQDWKIERLAP